jgi:transposase
MARPESIKIVEHMPIEELEKLAKTRRESLSPAQIAAVSRNIGFIRMRYRGFSVEEASGSVGITKPTGFKLQYRWNTSGFDGLIPGYSGGRRPRLSESDLTILSEALESEPMSTKSVRLFIRQRFGIDYSDKQVHVILTNLKMHHAKPYPKDHRRPADAEAVFKKGSKMLWYTSAEETS